MKTASEIEKIKNNLVKLSPENILEISDFIEFLLKKSSRSKGQKIKKLAGIWKGLGFENLNIEKEISNIRSDVEKSLLGK